MAKVETKRGRESEFDSFADLARPNKRRDASSGPEDAVPCPPLLDLPQEVLQEILRYACFTPPLSKQKADGNWMGSLTAIDFESVRSLLTSSRAIYATLTPMLYARPVITRPSALALLYRALQENAALRPLVKRISIDPSDELPADWWPLLRRDEERGGLGPLHPYNPLRRSHPPNRVNPNVLRRPECISYYIWDAIRSAHLDLGVRPNGPQHLWGPETLQKWLLGIFEVQAAVTVYEEELRRIERVSPTFVMTSQCSSLKCGHFPQLVLVHTDKRAAATGEPALWWRSERFVFVTRAELRARLAERWSMFDRFDHPVLFARSGLPVCAVDAQGRPQLNYKRASTDLAADGFEEAGALDAATFEGVVELVREVVALTGASVQIGPEVLADAVRIREEQLVVKAKEEKSE